MCVITLTYAMYKDITKGCVCCQVPAPRRSGLQWIRGRRDSYRGPAFATLANCCVDGASG